jgi:aminotransferase
MYINPRVKELEVSIIRQIAQKAAKMDDVINLTIGEPDIPTPRVIVEKSIEYMKNNQLKYAPTGGLEELRIEIAKFYDEKYGIKYDKDEVLITCGSTEALSTTLKGILAKDDEVIIINPAFSLYDALVHMYDAKAVHIDVSKNDFILTSSMIEEVINEKTKAIILNYPSNPSGTILPKENIVEIANFLANKDIYIISDEIYSEVIFGKEEYYSIAKCDNVKDKVIVINGFSKSHSMTGWRIGYLLAPLDIRKELIKVNQYTITSPSTLSEYGAIVALQEVSDVSSMAEEYGRRANLVTNRLRELGFEVADAQGAFYIFANYKKFSDKDSLTFVLDILEKAKVALVPGSAFGVDGYIRVACTLSLDNLKTAMDRLEKYLNS